jgi:hypothetical protein
MQRISFPFFATYHWTDEDNVSNTGFRVNTVECGLLIQIDSTSSPSTISIAKFFIFRPGSISLGKGTKELSTAVQAHIGGPPNGPEMRYLQQY